MKKLVTLLLTAFVFLSTPVGALDAPVKVVVTFSLLGDLVKHIGGSSVDVTTLAGPDADIHAYKPTPYDGRSLAQADLVIENGLGLEGWIGRLIMASGYKGPVLVASDGIVPRSVPAEGPMAKGQAVTDPHAWLDVAMARVYVKNINAALDKASPANAALFDANAKAYDAELQKLDAWIRGQLEGIPASRRNIMIGHDAFGYFGAAYGVHFIAAEGVSAESEPTAAQIGRLIEQIKAEKIKRLLVENMANPALMSSIARDTGATVGPAIYADSLSRADGVAPTYAAMMRYDTAQFTAAMTLD